MLGPATPRTSPRAGTPCTLRMQRRTRCLRNACYRSVCKTKGNIKLYVSTRAGSWPGVPTRTRRTHKRRPTLEVKRKRRCMCVCTHKVRVHADMYMFAQACTPKHPAQPFRTKYQRSLPCGDSAVCAATDFRNRDVRFVTLVINTPPPLPSILPRRRHCRTRRARTHARQ